MKIISRINAFVELGSVLEQKINSSDDELEQTVVLSRNMNAWFTTDNVLFSLRAIVQMLEKKNLEQWIDAYSIKDQGKRVGLIMAGNIPLVGFHDFLSVLLSGNKAIIKMSSEDRVLLPYITRLLVEIEPRFQEYIEIAEERLPKNIEAVIATGSNNSSRYFEYYFGKYPNIIRKNRNSVAVLTGEETDDALKLLGEDVFRYFGLGCRNVSKLYLPEGYKVDRIFEALFHCKDVSDHNKYANNYTYQRALLLMNSVKFFDNNFLIMKETEDLISPIGVLNFEYYNSLTDLNKKLQEIDDQIQCVVCEKSEFNHSRKVGLGEAQNPNLIDYADGVDTLKFLTALN